MTPHEQAINAVTLMHHQPFQVGQIVYHDNDKSWRFKIVGIHQNQTHYGWMVEVIYADYPDEQRVFKVSANTLTPARPMNRNLKVVGGYA